MRSEEVFLGKGDWRGSGAAREGKKRGTEWGEGGPDRASVCPHLAGSRLGGRKRGRFGSSLGRRPTLSPGTHHCTTIGLFPHLESVFFNLINIHEVLALRQAGNWGLSSEQSRKSPTLWRSFGC